MKISVIVPVYNMEQYIEATITSIMEQSLKDLEVLCVDDGSTDGTPATVTKLQEKYPNLHVLRQKNLGPGIARNKALKVANGKYIAFIDGDDLYPERNTLEELYDLAEQQNALICGGTLQTFDKDGHISSYSKSILSENGFVDSTQFPNHFCFQRFIYNKEFLKTHRIMFPDYTRGEDPVFLLKAFIKAKKVYCINKSTYLYRIHHKKTILSSRNYIDYAKSCRDSLKLAKKSRFTRIAEFIVAEMIEIVPYLYFLSERFKVASLTVECNRLYRAIFPNKNPPFYGKSVLKQYRYEHSISYLQKKVAHADKILIYGAGKVAQHVYEYLHDKKIIPDAFVVSSCENNPQKIDGIPVQNIDDFQNIKKRCFVIIAVGKTIQNEVLNVLREKNFSNFYKLDGYELFLLQLSESKY